MWATIALVITPAAIHVANPTGRVVAVADGDTLTIRTDAGETVKVRLAGIDPRPSPPPGTPVAACGLIASGGAHEIK